MSMNEEPLVFEWPDTGRLEIHPSGKRAVTLRFTPSEAAILDGLRKAGVEPRYGDFTTGHPHTHEKQPEAFCAIPGGSGADLGFTITKPGGIITQRRGSDTERPLFDTEDTDMMTEKLCGYEEYAARYNHHLQNGGLGACAEDLFLMAAALREEGRRHDELKALMLSFYFDLSGTGSGPAVNRNTAKRAHEAVTAAGISVHEMEELYLDTIQKDTVPAPIMSVRDSLYIFELCLGGQHDEAEEILGKFVEGARK